ncbi:MAG: VOC family protein [Candidatus Omnitrophica bacterium]|nr:VOC family protein [Candidatus Omnitrophota bacterium]
MIKVQGIDHVAINVSDLEKSLEFYTQVIGLKVTEREYSKPGVEVFLDCGTSLVGLIQGKEGEGKHLLEDGGIGGNHVSFRVDTKEFDRAAEEIRRRGLNVTFLKKREKSWSVYFLDPDGNKLEMTAWPLEDQK